MARLEVRLLGPFRAELDGQPITIFESSKVRALLAYLMVEADRVHPRSILAGFFWPDCSDRIALVNLRSALSNLRQALAEHETDRPHVLVSHDAVRFNTASDHWLDAARFARLAAAAGRDLASIEELTEAAALYSGDFLSGLSIRDSDLFEGWALLKREQFTRLLAAVLRRLAVAKEYRGEYAEAQAYARRWGELDPLDEAAHRQLMRALAVDGRRNAALAQYEACRNTLEEELRVAPARETVRLFKTIRDGELRPLLAPAITVAPLGVQVATGVAPAFAGRKPELARLSGWLGETLDGRGRLGLIAGSAGSGKTALAAEFIQQALQTHRNLSAAWGRCSAWPSGVGAWPSGVGTAYLPFLEILQLLTGQVQVGEPGTSGYELHTLRLARMLPKTLQALVEFAPDLINTFLPGTMLLDCALRDSGPGQPWLRRLEQLASRQGAPRYRATLQQTAVVTQYTALLLALARQQPLVLFLDDSQWADEASCALLSHLARHLAGSPILLLCAYRSEDIVPRPGAAERLGGILRSLRSQHEDMLVDLDRSAGEEFIGDLLDAEPNRLGADFRRTLYRHTGGHPLFTVELLRGMRTRGDLVQDEAGLWVAGHHLNWSLLPSRVEAVIEERLSGLDKRWREFLAAASVEGEEFSAEVIAALCGVTEREAIAQLSGELSQRHHLVHAQGLRRIGQRTLSRYRFRHTLFEVYLYRSLDEVERMRLHTALGRMLETIYCDRTNEISLDLARHFERAGLHEQAADYLVEAGNQAVRLSGYEDAIGHFHQALRMLDSVPPGLDRDLRELRVRVDMGVPLLANQGFGAAEVERNYARARELSSHVPASSQHFRILSGLKSYYDLRLQLPLARELGEEMLREAERLRDPMLLARAHDALGVTLFYQGQGQALLDHLAKLEAICGPSRQVEMSHQFGFDPLVACLSNASWALWILGYPEQAKRRSGEALALAEKLAHPPTLAYARFFAAAFHRYCRRLHPTWELLSATEALANEHGLALWQAAVLAMKGWIMSQEGQAEVGLQATIRGQSRVRAMGAELAYLRALPGLAESYARAGCIGEGLTTIDEALALTSGTGMVADLPEIWRWKGHLLEMSGASDEAETCFRQAMAVAQEQGARSWELRALLSLCRLWQGDARQKKALTALAELYSWFTEGFDELDLCEARALLVPSTLNNFRSSP